MNTWTDTHNLSHAYVLATNLSNISLFLQRKAFMDKKFLTKKYRDIRSFVTSLQRMQQANVTSVEIACILKMKTNVLKAIQDRIHKFDFLNKSTKSFVIGDQFSKVLFKIKGPKNAKIKMERLRNAHGEVVEDSM